MEQTTEDIVAHVREWSIERAENTNHENSQALYEEYKEWIELKDTEELEIVSLEHIEEYLKD